VSDPSCSQRPKPKTIASCVENLQGCQSRPEEQRARLGSIVGIISAKLGLHRGADVVEILGKQANPGAGVSCPIRKMKAWILSACWLQRRQWPCRSGRLC